MSNNLIAAPYLWNGKKIALPIMVFDHTGGGTAVTRSHGGTQRTRNANTIWGMGVPLQFGPGGLYCAEFRFPHPKKKEFWQEFCTFNASYKLASPTIQGTKPPLYVTYGKHMPDTKPLLSKSAIAGLLEGGMLGAAVGVGDGAALVAVAAGTALGGPIMIAVSVGIVGAIIAGTAIKQHVENKKSGQVFLRVSNDPITTRKIWSYEEKIYQSTFYDSGSVTFKTISQELKNWA